MEKNRQLVEISAGWLESLGVHDSALSVHITAATSYLHL